MSITGIASSILSGVSGSQHGQSKFQQVRDEFKQLAQDLQSGNLAQAQQDFTTLSKNLPGISQTSSATASQVSSATGSTAGGTTGTGSLLQEFNKLGQDLKSGNLQAAQQDFSSIQQSAQQISPENVQPNSQQVGGHHRHHHHHVENSQQTSPSSSSLQQTSAIGQAFNQLAQTLQSGNLHDAQQAFSALQNDLQQVGGFTSAGSSDSGGAATSTSAGSLNITV
jgi:hypothetical protein